MPFPCPLHIKLSPIIKGFSNNLVIILIARTYTLPNNCSAALSTIKRCQCTQLCSQAAAAVWLTESLCLLIPVELSLIHLLCRDTWESGLSDPPLPPPVRPCLGLVYHSLDAPFTMAAASLLGYLPLGNSSKTQTKIRTNPETPIIMASEPEFLSCCWSTSLLKAALLSDLWREQSYLQVCISAAFGSCHFRLHISSKWIHLLPQI